MPSSYPTGLDNIADHVTGDSITAALGNSWSDGINALQLDGRQGAVFNVRHYGATGRNSADDTTAIQAAITAAGAASTQSINGRGIVLVPPGDYMVTAQLVVNSDNITIRGSGPVDSAQFIQPLGGSDMASMIRFGSTRSVTAPALENITLVCGGTSRTSGTHTTGHGVIFDANQPMMKHVRVQYAPQDGIQWIATGTGGGPSASFEGFAIDVSVHRPGRDGFLVDANHFNEELFRVIIHGDQFDGTSTRNGFMVQGGAIKLIACHPYHCGYNSTGLISRAGSTTTVCNIPTSFIPNPGNLVGLILTYTSGANSGVARVISANTTTTITTAAFGSTPATADTFSVTGGAGLQFDSSQDLHVVSGEYETCFNGINIGPGCRFTIDGVNCYGANSADIVCTNTNNGGRITNSTFISAVPSQVYLLGSTPGCEDVQITGNYFNNGTANSLRVDNGIRGIISGNMIAAQTGATRGILLNNTSRFTVNGNLMGGYGSGGNFPKPIVELGTSNNNLFTANQLNGTAITILGAASVAVNNMA
jgi:hypothetical protein